MTDRGSISARECRFHSASHFLRPLDGATGLSQRDQARQLLPRPHVNHCSWSHHPRRQGLPAREDAHAEQEQHGPDGGQLGIKTSGACTPSSRSGATSDKRTLGQSGGIGRATRVAAGGHTGRYHHPLPRARQGSCAMTAALDSVPNMWHGIATTLYTSIDAWFCS